ncbi:erythromycin esterase family protein [Niastella populi]|uniref:Protein-L-isoaspartate O-methyltransferase n=1 Tax=Niastella populi TaxID=550983 RepID=A0A1V9F830_9BACT|nr:erythromycin esterase family protein [Niastella populi]OQP54397.1 protein-L-isoaspartate O-methyltransferase [Niastella populi]
MYNLSNANDLSALIDAAGDRLVVMLGEASHGTHEYYTWRSAITKRLIEEYDFDFIAVEGDWPDCYKINRYIKGYKDAGDNIRDVLQVFDRWPTWMWANWEVAALAEWLREHNSHKSIEKKIGFYGLDVYSLWDSMDTMLKYLDKEDPAASAAVKKAIHCFEPFREREQSYAYSLREHNCRDTVLSLLKEVRMKAQYLNGDREAAFNTEQNALIAVNAEKYYSSLIGFDNESWNIRDTHMMETLERLRYFHGLDSKGIVWEHNTHIGDARATDMLHAGMINIGELGRKQYGDDDVYLVGFGSYEGTVIAGEAWGAPMEEMDVPPARKGSIEEELHRRGKNNRYMLFEEEIEALYDEEIDHRAIGVVYDPGREKYGNYVSTIMSQRYDAFIYLDTTKALHPLHLPTGNTMPDTFPFGV